MRCVEDLDPPPSTSITTTSVATPIATITIIAIANTITYIVVAIPTIIVIVVITTTYPSIYQCYGNGFEANYIHMLLYIL